MNKNPKNFALIGAAGFVAPRHMKAIAETGNRLVCAVDLHDSVGVLDRWFPKCEFFTDMGMFFKYMNYLKGLGSDSAIDYISICSPNYLHMSHCNLAMLIGADAICEKPIVIKSYNIDDLCDNENKYNRKIWAVLQLRLLPNIEALKSRMDEDFSGYRHEVVLTYVTRRGQWYDTSWKGNQKKSGGLLMNIGIHFFDLLLWIFGGYLNSELHLEERNRMAGYLELEKANIKWFLSTDEKDLPMTSIENEQFAYRSISFDGEIVDLSHNFNVLHTEVYREILLGNGFDIQDAALAISLINVINNCEVTSLTPIKSHPKLL